MVKILFLNTVNTVTDTIEVQISCIGILNCIKLTQPLQRLVNIQSSTED